MSTVVYEPCPHCFGNGWVYPPSSQQWTQPNVMLGPRMICEVCHGTGKGKIKEIREQ